MRSYHPRNNAHLRPILHEISYQHQYATANRERHPWPKQKKAIPEQGKATQNEEIPNVKAIFDGSEPGFD